MTDLLEIPDFLKREETKDERFWERLRARNSQHPGSFIKMPNVRRNAKRDAERTASRTVPSRDKTKNRDAGTYEKKKDPITLAVVLATDGPTKRASLMKVAKENGIDGEDRWGHLNTGMVAMNLTNVLRGRYFKYKKVTVGGSEIE